jgi:hypothetical protein
MAGVERIDSLYDVSKIIAEQQQILEGVQQTKKALMDLYSSINNFKQGSNTVNVAENWNRVSVAMAGVSDSSNQLMNNQRQLADSFNKMAAAEADLNQQRATSKTKTLDQIKATLAAKEANQNLTKEIIAQTDAYKALELQANRAVQQAKALQAEALKNPADLSLRTKADKASTEANQLVNQLKAIDAGVGDSRRKVGSYTDALKVLENQLAAVKANMTTLAAAGQEGSDSYKQLEHEAGLLNTLVGQQQKGFSSLTMELRNAERGLETMRQQGLQDTEAFQQLRISVVEATRQQREFIAQQRLLERDAPLLASLTIAAKGLAGAYAVGAGAAALFSSEDEKVQKELQKLVAIMTILQGLQEAYEIFEKRAAIAIAIRTGLTKGAAAAMELYTVVTEAATSATAAFDAALVATGIGAVIIALGILIANIVDHKSSLQDDLEEQNKFNDSLKQYNDILVETNKELEDRLNIMTESMKNEEEIASINARSISDYEKLSKLKHDIAKQSGEAAQKELDALGLTEDGILQMKKQYATLNAALQETISLQIEHRKLFDDKGLKENQELAEAYKHSAEAIKVLIDRGDVLVKQLNQSDNDIAKLNAEDKKFADEQYEKKIAALSRMRIAYEETLAARAKIISDSPEATQSARINALQDEFKLQSKIIEDNRKQQLRDAMLNSEQIQAINYDAYLKQFQLAEDIGVKIQKVKGDEYLKEQQDIKVTTDFFITEEQRKLEAAKKLADEELKVYDSINSSIEGDRSGSTIENNKKYVQGLLDEDAFNEAKARIQIKYDREQALNNIAKLQEQQRQNGMSLQLDAQLAKEREKLSELEVKETELNENKKAKIRSKFVDLGAQFSDLSKTLIDARYQNELNHIQDLMDANTKLHDQEIQRIEGSTLAEQDKANKIQILNAKTAAQQNEYALQQKKIKHDQAVVDKAFAVANAIEQGVLATLSALKTGGPVYAAIVGAIAAIQVAKIIATPIPSYFVGTEDHPGGPARLHKGEIVMEPGKDPILTKRDNEIVSLSRHTKVIPETEVNQLMRYTTEKMFVDTAGKLVMNNNERSMEKLTDAVNNQTKVLAKVFRKQKQPIVNIVMQSTDYYMQRIFK